MRFIAVIMMVLMIGVAFTGDVTPASTTTDAVAAPQIDSESVQASGSLIDALKAFAQSQGFIGVLLAAWAYAAAKLFTRKPKWRVYYDQYRGVLIAAVRYAEKAIPDDVEDKSAKRLDAALKYTLQIIGQADQASLSQAVNVVHDEVQG